MPENDYDDKMIVCADCGNEFLHSAEDQRLYAERGLLHEPKRCRACRAQRKAQRGGGRPSGHGEGSREGSGPRRSGPRELHDAVCASCGQPTQVPFKPVQGRPVYCRDCYRAQQ